MIMIGKTDHSPIILSMSRISLMSLIVIIDWKDFFRSGKRKDVK